MRYLLSFLICIILAILPSTPVAAQSLDPVSGAVVREVVAWYLENGSDQPGRTAVDSRAVEVEWSMPGAHWRPRYVAAMVDDYGDAGGPDLTTALEGLGVEFQTAAIIGCMRSETCEDPPSRYLRVSIPVVEGDSAWVFFQTLYPYVDSRGGPPVAESHGVAILCRAEEGWVVASRYGLENRH